LRKACMGFKLKIGLDARNILSKQTGIGRRAYHLIKRLSELDSENEYIIIKRSSYQPKIVDKENFREISIPYDPSSFRSCFLGFKEINDLTLDIYHSFFHFLPGRLQAKRIIVTLHDLMWIDYPELVFNDFFRQRFIRIYGNIFIKRALENSDSIVAISNQSKQHALKRYNLSAEKIHVIYNGIDHAYFDKYASRKIPDAFQNRKYIYSIGHTRPYKNIPRVITAFKRISDEFPDVELIIVGRGDYESKLKKQVAEYELQNRVIFVGHLPDEIMIPLFKNALFLVFPSLIEGFGLPLIEAMELGCPVLASNIPVIEEICGDAYEKVDPYSAVDIAKGMSKLLSSEIYREDLREKGHERAKFFSWEESAKELLSLFRNC
jgi:glycosyltransferase involved in cell wall biosynthesis